MGVYPEIWGPHAWAFIHLMIISEKEPLDKSRLKYYKQFFDLLTNLLPCEKCRLHLKDNLTKLKDITKIKSKKELFNWSVDLHNMVNKITNKPEYGHKEMMELWTGISNGDKPVLNEKIIHNNTYKWLFLITLLILLIVIIKLKNSQI